MTRPRVGERLGLGSGLGLGLGLGLGATDGPSSDSAAWPRPLEAISTPMAASAATQPQSSACNKRWQPQGPGPAPATSGNTSSRQSSNACSPNLLGSALMLAGADPGLAPANMCAMKRGSASSRAASRPALEAWGWDG